MPRTAWATADEIQEIATSIPGIDISGMDEDFVDSAVAYAVSQAELATGWSPLLAPAEEADKIFRAPDNLSGQILLVLPSPIRVEAEITIGYDPLDSTGTATAIYTDWFPYEEAINVVEFHTRPTPGPKRVKVSQRWGRFEDEIPEDMWKAVAMYAIGVILVTTQGSGSAAIEFSQDSVRFRFSEQTFNNSSFMTGGPLAVGYEKMFKNVCSQYARIWS